MNLKLNEYKQEKDQILEFIEENGGSCNEICEKLENEIIGYKNMADSCLKTCSELSGEIMYLRKEIEKYSLKEFTKK